MRILFVCMSSVNRGIPTHFAYEWRWAWPDGCGLALDLALALALSVALALTLALALSLALALTLALALAPASVGAVTGFADSAYTLTSAFFRPITDQLGSLLT